MRNVAAVFAMACLLGTGQALAQSDDPVNRGVNVGMAESVSACTEAPIRGPESASPITNQQQKAARQSLPVTFGLRF